MALNTPTKPSDPDMVRVRSTATFDSGKNLRDVKALKMHFPLAGDHLPRQVGAVREVDARLLRRKEREARSVGEVGCGKSTNGRAILPAL